MDNYVITISRRFASSGHAIAERMSGSLGIPVYDRSSVEAREQHTYREDHTALPQTGADGRDGISQGPSGMGRLKGLLRQDRRAEEEDLRAQAEFAAQSDVIRSLVSEGSCIIIGRCADVVLRDYPRALHVFIYADMEERIGNCMRMLHTGREEAIGFIENEDRAREAYRRRFSGHGTDEIYGRHILIDSGKLGVEESAEVLSGIARHLFCEENHIS